MFLQCTVSDSSFLLLPFQYLFTLNIMCHLLVILCSVHLLKLCFYIFLLFSQSSNYLLWIICFVFSVLGDSSYLQVREGNGTLLQYSSLENPMVGGAWWAVVHGVAKSQAQLNNFTFTFHFHALEKEMATHSSVFAWRIPAVYGVAQSWTRLK